MRKIAPLLVLLLLPAFLYGQDIQKETRSYLTRLGVSGADITRIIDLQMSTRRQAREAQLQLNVLKAELERALFPINVDMKTVHRLLQESLQWKMKAELANIQERVEVRRILGDYRYAEYVRFLRSRHDHERPNRNSNPTRNH